MATPQKIKNKNGSTSYRIFVNANGKRESKRFSTRHLAIEWADGRIKEIEREGIYGKKTTALIKDVIDDYQKQFGSEYGRSKNYDMERLKKYELAEIEVNKLTPAILIAHCIYRRDVDKVKPQTAGNDIIWLRTALQTMSAVTGFDYDEKVFDVARITLKKEKLIAKSDIRSRIPTWGEMLNLTRHFKKCKSKIPMVDILWFAYFSSRRVSEITRIEWTDNNDDKQTGMVRDAKHPREKKGNHRRFKYEKSAWKIMQRQKQKNGFIFPYNPKTISTNFERACKVLNIQGLHFHDLRHAAVTRLFNKGYQINEVKMFSLHFDWKTLERYANTKPEDIKSL